MTFSSAFYLAKQRANTQSNSDYQISGHLMCHELLTVRQ